MKQHRASKCFAFAIVLTFIAPLGGADHWTLFHADFDNSPAYTSEDDEEVMTTRNPRLRHLDGLVNKVVPPHHIPGDGSLFLDARVGQAVGPYDFYAAHFTEEIHGKRNIIFPGYVRISAWYGWWNDMDGNGVITDHHDGANEPTDEFRWRGVASGESLTIMSWWDLVHAALDSYDTPEPGEGLQDHTARSNAHQGWSRNSAQYSRGPETSLGYTHSLLSTVRTLVAAGAPFDLGTGGIDLRHETTLIDVDAYTALSPDVEMLYSSTFDIVRGQYAEVRRIYAQAYEDIIQGNDLEDTFWSIVSLPFEIYSTGFTAVFDEFEKAGRLTASYDPKEPNHADDDYEDRAIFGGVGDRLGSYNVYPGYEREWGFYFDNVMSSQVCVGAQGQRQCSSVPGTPRLPAGNQQRAPGNVLGFQGYAILWHDANRDTFIGERCNRDDPDEFEADRNTCHDAPYPWGHTTYHYRETIPICQHSSLRVSVVTLTPIGGGWDGAIILRDTQATTQFVTNQNWEVREDSDPIELRWRENCVSSLINTIDVVVPPVGGFRHPIRVEAIASIPGYVDSTLGIEVGPQMVKDVDIITPRL